MPGTIMVSVLEFMDLPLSSSTSIRASMGKLEYQMSDKGNFSFPLTSLRDDLIFKILDAEGNEMSRTGVQIRLILEKGVWEENFPLGGGHLRLKLQFILSDEERERIRSLRQSALKKKHDELLSSGRRGAESDDRTVTSNAALPFRTNDEKLNSYECGPTFPQRLFPDVVSAPSSQESPKRLLQHEAVSRMQGPASSSSDKESDPRNVAGPQLDQKKQLIPNIADQYKETSSTKPLSQAVIPSQLQHKGKKPSNQSPYEKHPQRAIGSEEIAILFDSEKNDALTSNLIQPNLVEGGLQYSEKKISPGRTPSNVRKMISAFEGGLAKDDRSNIKPPPTKHQAISIEGKDYSKTRHLEQDKSRSTEPVELSQERVKSVSLNAAYVGTGTEGSKYEKIQEIKESKPKTSADNGDENSGGPINQVVKVAIIIGFGLLVLVFRQRKRRMKKKAE
ncbi:uncharacterized protein LOC109806098 isoform X2 [Cajanus cajan]|uniref:uncharacterized protein LOC109806098 isoform X2 n=1 Tax=Cajanus cajan TaxID=3821 RepID=UPI00098D8A6A|nr:uncharacterized protein LOC109806098 isoform X2 [Cajanus cajan]